MPQSKSANLVSHPSLSWSFLPAAIAATEDKGELKTGHLRKNIY
jgi:hypothetical protein